MKKYARMFAGMLIGVLGSLTLTLNIWGDNWYQIVISTVVGILAGMFITDHKASAGIFVDVFYKIFKTFSGNKMSSDDENAKKAVFFEIIGLLSVIAFFILMILLTMILTFDFSANDVVFPGFLIAVAVSSVLIMNSILSSVFGGRWALYYGYKPQHQIWGDESRYLMDFEEAVRGLSYRETFRRCFLSTFLTFKGMVIREVRWLYYDIPIFIASFAIMLLLVIPWLIRGIGRHGHLMAVAFSILLGCVIGTLVHSFLIGVLVGSSVIAINYVCSLFKINPAWGFQNLNFAPAHGPWSRV
jgi:hypothetical protein